jgi:proline iminopeptidase
MTQTEGIVQLEKGMGLFYRSFGSSSDVVVAPNAHTLAEEFQPLSEGRRLIFYDQRGRGGSTPISDDSLIWTDYEAQDIEDLRSQLGLKNFALMGWSYMGAIAALYAHHFPGHTSRLVLICPIAIRQPAPYDEEDRRAREAAEAKIDQGELKIMEEMKQNGIEESDPKSFCRQHNRVYLPTRMADSKVFDNLKSDPCIYPNEWPSNLAKHWERHFPPESIEHDWRQELSHLELPTLIIHGSDDVIPLASSEEWAATLPNARLLIIQGCGHFPFVEAPDIFFPSVKRFLGGRWPEEAKKVKEAS